MRNARAVALGVGHGLPVALEGDTAASKTTAILWLAHLLNQPVVRLNLHGQTDTGELVGRYVPGECGENPRMPQSRHSTTGAWNPLMAFQAGANTALPPCRRNSARFHGVFMKVISRKQCAMAGG